MERFAHFENEYQKYIGKEVSRQALLGRNYFFVEGGKVKDDLCLAELDDFELSDSCNYGEFYDSFDKGNDIEEISCIGVKAYCAAMWSQTAWLKCLPTHPCDVEPGSAYIVLQLKVDEHFRITSIRAFTRFMDGMNGCFPLGGCFFEMPHVKESMASHFSHMPMFPPEVLTELDMLVAGRYFEPGFSFVGKPLPQYLDCMNGCDGAKTIARASAFRDAYFHLSIYLDDENLIESFNFREMLNERTMFQRPYSTEEDIIDGLDCALMLLDAYTEEQYLNLK